MKRALLVIAVLALAAPSAAQRRPVVIDDQFRFADVGSPDLSPDGQWVVYTVATTDAAADRRNVDLWIVKWDGSERRALTHTADASETSPRWSRDGSKIAFLSARPGPARGSQVWVLDWRGGEARQITGVRGGVSDFDWAPDGTRLVIVGRHGTDVDDSPSDRTDRSGANRPLPPPIVIDKYQFKRDGQTYVTGTSRNRLFIQPIDGGAATLLTSDGDYDESSPVWSPDGQAIAFVSNHDENRDRTRNTDVFVVEARPGAASRRLTTFDGPDGSGLAWSPDSRLIAYGQGSAPKLNFHSLTRLAVVEASGGRPRVLTEALDRGTSLAGFTADGRRILFTVADDRASYLAAIAPDGGAVERLVDGLRVVGSPAPAAGRVAVTSGTSTEPTELFAVEGRSLRRLTHHNDEVVAGLQLQPAENIEFTSRDGTRVHGLLTRPVGAVAGRRYPTLLRIHGGPTAQDAHAFQFERQIFAANGYAVVNVNYRGSSGRGAKFQEAIFADWGRLEVEDVLAATEHVVSLGVADPEKLGIGGWSYGGLTTDYVIASDTRFKAAISGAGSANHISLYGHDQYTYLYDSEFGPPWENVDLWIKFSYPFFKANRITTPTLFMGGQDDFNVPILGSEQMYQALKTLNVPTQLVVYPGQNHGLTRVPYLRDRLERYLAWYDRYLQPERRPVTSSGPPK